MHKTALSALPLLWRCTHPANKSFHLRPCTFNVRMPGNSHHFSMAVVYLILMKCRIHINMQVAVLRLHNNVVADVRDWQIIKLCLRPACCGPLFRSRGSLDRLASLSNEETLHHYKRLRDHRPQTRETEARNPWSKQNHAR